MKPELPSGEFLAAAAARRLRREQEEKARRAVLRGRLRLALLAGAALLLVALVADLRNLSARAGGRALGRNVPRPGNAADIAAGLDDPRYVDPAGRFSVVPPRHWVKQPSAAGDFYDVVFRGPYGMDLCIQVSAAPGLTFDGLIEKLRRRERELSADMHMDVAYVGPHRAVKRSVQLFRSRVLLLDFLTGDLAHHVQFGAPPDLYDQYEPVLLRLLQTYEAGRILPVAEAPAAP